MARPNVQRAAAAMAPEKVTASVAVMGNFEHGGGNGGDEVAERQARAIMSTAKRALEAEEEEDSGGGGGNEMKLSMRKSLEWFLESRRKRTASAGAGGEYGSSSSCSN